MKDDLSRVLRMARRKTSSRPIMASRPGAAYPAIMTLDDFFRGRDESRRLFDALRAAVEPSGRPMSGSRRARWHSVIVTPSRGRGCPMSTSDRVTPRSCSRWRSGAATPPALETSRRAGARPLHPPPGIMVRRRDRRPGSRLVGGGVAGSGIVEEVGEVRCTSPGATHLRIL